MGTGKYSFSFIFPVQPATSRIDNLTRLIQYSLLQAMTIPSVAFRLCISRAPRRHPAMGGEHDEGLAENILGAGSFAASLEAFLRQENSARARTL